MDQKLFELAFAHARLKIDRANRHIHEAQHWFRLYVEEDFYDIRQDTDPKTGRVVLRIDTAGVPHHLVLAIGDAFHCLNAALDYVMSGLMKAKTGDSTRVHFPTDESRKALRDSFMPPRPGKKSPPRRRIVEAFPLIALELLSVIKPYPGGNFALWEIRKADNIDKHNLIVPSVTVTEISGIDVIDDRQNAFCDMTVVVQAGTANTPVAYGPNAKLEIKNKGQATARVSFADDMDVFAGKPVFPTLLESSQFAAEAVSRIEAIARRYL